MIVCPVCEHSQAQGAECEVCGKRLVLGATGIPPVPAVEGLEHTLHGAVAPRVEALPGLEPTRFAEGAFVEDHVPGLDIGRAGPIDVDSEPVPDIERTASGLPDDGPAGVPALIVCRYCRTPATFDERICARCGMRLPTVESLSSSAPTDEPRMCGCGMPVRGNACPNCGARMG